jgi:hypothetical protein
MGQAFQFQADRLPCSVLANIMPQQFVTRDRRTTYAPDTIALSAGSLVTKFYTKYKRFLTGPQTVITQRAYSYNYYINQLMHLIKCIQEYKTPIKLLRVSAPRCHNQGVILTL